LTGFNVKEIEEVEEKKKYYRIFLKISWKEIV